MRRPRPDAISGPMASTVSCSSASAISAAPPWPKACSAASPRRRACSICFDIDSAGLGDWHVGQAPDTRAQDGGARSRHRHLGPKRAAGRRPPISPASISCSQWTARTTRSSSSLRRATRGTRSAASSTSRRMRGTQDVPDPFYGGREGFDHALDLIEQAARGLLAELLGDDEDAGEEGRSSPRADRPPRPHRVRRRPNCARSRARSG